MLCALVVWTLTGSFTGIVSIIFPILTIIAGGIAILAYGSNKVLRDTAEDLRKRVVDLELDRDALQVRANSQAAELSVWKKAVTGEVQLTAILDLLSDHHKEAVREWAKNRVIQGDLITAMHQLKTHIEERMK